MARKRRKRKSVKKPVMLLVFIILLILLIIFVSSKAKSEHSKSKESNNTVAEVNIENKETLNSENKESKTVATSIEVKSNTENNNETINKTDSNESNKKYSGTLKNGLPVLMYHFFYDKNETTGQDSNWMEISDFEAQLKYLSENNFYFPTWKEVEDYIDGKITLPEKSIVITVDDGDDSFFELAVPVIQKYNAKATSFVITSWYGYRAGNKQSNISYQSHSDCMHEGASNGKGVMLSWSYDKIMNDVKQSSEILGGATIFCYPFGQYNDLDKKVLKDSGYKLAFTTEGGRVYKGSDKYALPRVRMSRGISLSSFASMVN